MGHGVPEQQIVYVSKSREDWCETARARESKNCLRRRLFKKMGGGEPQRKNTVSDSLPGYFGYYGFPLAPNDPCEKCAQADLCRKIREVWRHGGC
jgi:hypothetical protein